MTRPHFSRDPADADPRLILIFSAAKLRFERKHPDLNVFITCTHRSQIAQIALFAQGRSDLAVVNELRANADLPRINTLANTKTVTMANAGKSKHNFYPSKAIDVAIKRGQILEWDIKFFAEFADIWNFIAMRENVATRWGGLFKKADGPHFELHDNV